jgi:hypothetical protein
MDTKQWGTPMWEALHSISFGYPENPTKQDEQNYYNFYTNLQYVLPCSLCRESYATFIKCIPLKEYLSSRDRLTFWVFSIHNEVNRKLGKSTNFPFEEVEKKYNKMYAKCKSKSN